MMCLYFYFSYLCVQFIPILAIAGAQDIYDQNYKLVMGMLWRMLCHFHVESESKSFKDLADSCAENSKYLGTHYLIAVVIFSFLLINSNSNSISVSHPISNERDDIFALDHVRTHLYTNTHLYTHTHHKKNNNRIFNNFFIFIFDCSKTKVSFSSFCSSILLSSFNQFPF